MMKRAKLKTEIYGARVTPEFKVAIKMLRKGLKEDGKDMMEVFAEIAREHTKKRTLTDRVQALEKVQREHDKRISALEAKGTR